MEDRFISDVYVSARFTVKANISSRSAFDGHETTGRPRRSFRTINGLISRHMEPIYPRATGGKQHEGRQE
jgi:hypothetical protein